MSVPGETWFDEAAGPLVRPYAVTRGRTRAAVPHLELITLVVAVQPEVHGAAVEPECAHILRVCALPRSVAEVAARVDLPLCVVKVLISDLIERKYMIFRAGPPPATPPDLTMLQKVLDGIRKL
ncbi:DUF742 domain-containing protein [Gandjariella thermophila]|uniref:DUF742 domain-containing protein n=1 Tax=Gandjariella thermophila TaxID=1931992 RepID=A0A4D4J8M0_9PSEU|nr:DUF742 domain-containing protein [Gandjariella thermophila]GDY31008.1 hypothetical protein GTS_26410 [Gandjariella thermophila]